MNRQQINKFLIQKYEKKRDPNELLQLSRMYKDEERKEYLIKCDEFKKKIEQFNDENKEVLTSRKIRLGEEPKLISIEELKSREELSNQTIRILNEPYTFPEENVEQKLRIRSKRGPIPEEDDCQENEEKVFNNPWFLRFQTLKKFIQVARGVVYKNRMVKNLEILKKLTQEDIQKYESQGNALYPSQFNYLFKKFLQAPASSTAGISSNTDSSRIQSAVSWV